MATATTAYVALKRAQDEADVMKHSHGYGPAYAALSCAVHAALESLDALSLKDVEARGGKTGTEAATLVDMAGPWVDQDGNETDPDAHLVAAWSHVLDGWHGGNAAAATT